MTTVPSLFMILRTGRDLERGRRRKAANYWTKSPTDMLRFLENGVGGRTVGSKNGPTTPTQFGNELRRLAPHLRAHGIDFTFGRTVKVRHITLTLCGRSGLAVDTPEDSSLE
jgi:hypothetical protein